MNTSSLIGINTSEGSGARTEQDDWLDEESTSQEKKWSNARTSFRHQEDNLNPRINWKNLQRLNEGYGEDGRKTDLRWKNIKADVRLFCDIVGLAGSEMDEVIDILDRIDYSSNNFGKRYEVIILAVMTYVRDKNISQMNGNPEKLMELRLTNKPAFKDLLDANNSGTTEIRKQRKKVREELN